VHRDGVVPPVAEAPDGLLKLASADHPARRGHQGGEQVELHRREVAGLAPAEHGSLAPVEDEAVAAQHAAGAVGGRQAASERGDPRPELHGVDREQHHPVGTGLKGPGDLRPPPDGGEHAGLRAGESPGRGAVARSRDDDGDVPAVDAAAAGRTDRPSRVANQRRAHAGGGSRREPTEHDPHAAAFSRRAAASRRPAARRAACRSEHLPIPAMPRRHADDASNLKIPQRWRRRPRRRPHRRERALGTDRQRTGGPTTAPVEGGVNLK